MKILLIGGHSNDERAHSSLKNFSNLLRTANPQLSPDLHTTHLDQVVLSIADNTFELYDSSNQHAVQDIDCLFIRGPGMRSNGSMVHHLSRYCDWNSITCINDFTGWYTGTKFSQSIVFLEHIAPALPTMYAMNKHNLIDRAGVVYGYPYILKTNIGSYGDSNYVINDKQQALRIITDEPNVDFLAQAYCPNNRDYRVLMVGDEKLVFERVGGTDTHLNNTSKGGIATKVDDAIPPDLLAKASKIARSLGLIIAGVDIIPHQKTGKLYFLEINSQPQMTTGVLLDEKKNLMGQLLKSLNVSS